MTHDIEKVADGAYFVRSYSTQTIVSDYGSGFESRSFGAGVVVEPEVEEESPPPSD